MSLSAAQYIKLLSEQKEALQMLYQSHYLLCITVLELGRTQDVVDVVDNFTVEHHCTVLLVALNTPSSTSIQCTPPSAIPHSTHNDHFLHLVLLGEKQKAAHSLTTIRSTRASLVKPPILHIYTYGVNIKKVAPLRLLLIFQQRVKIFS